MKFYTAMTSLAATVLILGGAMTAYRLRPSTTSRRIRRGSLVGTNTSTIAIT